MNKYDDVAKAGKRSIWKKVLATLYKTWYNGEDNRMKQGKNERKQMSFSKLLCSFIVSKA